MIFFPLRRLGTPARGVTGPVLIAAGAAVVAAAQVRPGLPAHGIILAAIGTGLCATGTAGCRARRTARTCATRDGSDA